MRISSLLSRGSGPGSPSQVCEGKATLQPGAKHVSSFGPQRAEDSRAHDVENTSLRDQGGTVEGELQLWRSLCGRQDGFTDTSFASYASPLPEEHSCRQYTKSKTEDAKIPEQQPGNILRFEILT